MQRDRDERRPAAAPGSAPEADLDELRRRLYRPGAGDEDVRRYEAVRPSAGTSAPEAEPAAPARSPVRARVVGALLVVVAVAAFALAAGPRPVATTPAPSTTARAELRDIGRGTAVDVRRGSQSSPEAVVTQLDGTPMLGRRVDGRGTAIVVLGPAADAERGRAVVAVSTGGGAAVTWRALLDVVRRDWTTDATVVAEGRASSPGRAVRPDAFSWTGGPPTRIAVIAPAGVRWSLVYAAAAGGAAELH